MPLNINLLSDDTIARGITPPDVGNFGTAFTGTQDYFQKQALQNLFANGLPIDPATGKPDWTRAGEMILRLQGAPGLPAATAAAKFGLISDQLRQSDTGGTGSPGFPPQPPTPGPQSSLTDEERPNVPSIQRTGGTPVASRTFDTPQNLGSVLGVQYGKTEGNPALFQTTAYAPPPASIAERFNAATDANVEDPNLPPNARPQEMQLAENTQRPRTQIFIPGPNPPGVQTQQSPTGDPGLVPGQNQVSGGLEISEQNAQRWEIAAQKKFKRGEALDLLEPGSGAAAKAEAAAYMATAKQIREGLTKNFELTPDQKAARDAGVPTLEYQRRQEAGKLDVKDYQETMTSINNAAQNAAVGLPKAQLGKQLTQQPNFYSGPWNEYATTFQQFRSLFGDPGTAMPNEAFNKVTNDMLQEQIKSMGQSGVGRVLMSEVAIMQRALASLGITEVSNRALLEITTRAYRKAMELAEVTKGIPPNSQQLRQAILGYLKKNQMFSDEERANPALLGSKEPPPQAAQWSRQQLMEWGRQNGIAPGGAFMFNGNLRQIPLRP